MATGIVWSVVVAMLAFSGVSANTISSLAGGQNCPEALCMLNPVTDAQTGGGAPYTLPSAANFTGFMDAVDCIASLEHRVCTFMIRTFFHDASKVNVTGRYRGADGSAAINDPETVSLGNAQHGTAAIARYVLRKLVSRYGLSYSDALSVAAAQCTQSLDRSAEKHVVSKICSDSSWPLLVGKLDNPSVSAPASYWVGKFPIAPGEFQVCTGERNSNCLDGQRTTYWVTLYNALNAVIANSYVPGQGGNFGEAWEITSTEGVALIGAHTLLPRSSCTMDDAGNLRVASWDNSYFKDVMSGNLTTPEVKALCVDTNGNTVMCASEDTTTVNSGCGFSAVWGNFQERSRSAANQILRLGAGIVMQIIPLRMRWYPDPASRAACNDPASQDPAVLPVSQCQACLANSTLPWCATRGVGEAFFPYLMIDASMAMDSKDGGPCRLIDKGVCLPFSTRDQAFVAEMGRAYHQFSQDVDAWKTTYAISHCKHSNIAAAYTDGFGVDLNTLTNGYSGTCDAAMNADVQDLLAELNEPAGECPAGCDA